MRVRVCAVVAALVLLAACAPKMDGSRTMMRAVTVTNRDPDAFTINRIVANNNPGDSNCTENPNARLAPGESYSTTFLICGNVARLDVETDRGTSVIKFSD